MILGLAVFVARVHAAPTCPRAIATNVTKTIDLPVTVSYFMRAAPGTREVSFASGGREPSRVLNVDTGRMAPVDGSIDPVLSPDGKILVIPQDIKRDRRTGAYRLETKTRGDADAPAVFTPAASVKKVVSAKSNGLNEKIDLTNTMVLYTRDRDGRPHLSRVDEKAQGNYQSLGVLRPNQYRMVYQGETGIRMQQYALGADAKIALVGGNRAVCDPNVTAALPIVSHDGSHLSYYDVDRQQTVVMAVDEAGGCREVGALPGLIGKPDFSADNQSLVFHVDEGINADTVMFENPSKDQKLGLYAYDLKSKRLRVLVDDPDAFSYYPVFLSDDEVAYVEARGLDAEQRMKIKIMKFNRDAGYGCRDCETTPLLRQASAVLGVLYGRACGFAHASLGNSLMGLARLTPEACREFVAPLSEDQVSTVQAELEKSVDWDPAHDPQFIKRFKYDVSKRPTRPRVTRDQVAEICGRIVENVAPSEPLRTAQ